VKVGVFTPLSSGLPLDQVLKKLSELNAHGDELGTGRYPATRIASFRCSTILLNSLSSRALLDGSGFTIGALSSHSNPLHPMRIEQSMIASQPEDDFVSRETQCSRGCGFQ
jgi:sugar phosphate isomerase/epimerase